MISWANEHSDPRPQSHMSAGIFSSDAAQVIHYTIMISWANEHSDPRLNCHTCPLGYSPLMQPTLYTTIRMISRTNVKSVPRPHWSHVYARIFSPDAAQVTYIYTRVISRADPHSVPRPLGWSLLMLPRLYTTLQEWYLELMCSLLRGLTGQTSP